MCRYPHLEEAGGEAVVGLVLQEVGQQVLRHLYRGSGGSRGVGEVKEVRGHKVKEVREFKVKEVTSAFLDSAAYSMASLNRLSFLHSCTLWPHLVRGVRRSRRRRGRGWGGGGLGKGLGGGGEGEGEEGEKGP